MKVKPLAKGLLTYIPGMERLLPARGPGGTDSARYCYGVWLKHLTLLWANGMRSIPSTLAELGPGPSLGVGLAAMLCGSNSYYALDVVRHANTGSNLKVLDELTTLFRERAQRPTKGWPDFDQYLGDDLFPGHILGDDLLEASLSDERIAAIRNAIESQELQTGEVTIKYMVPWSDSSVIERDTVDVILSHSVLEHVVHLESTYQALYAWLKRDGIMSHQVDFTSHGLSEAWNGHWTCSELQWKLILGRRPYLINQQPYSVHAQLIAESGFNMVCALRRHQTDGVRRSDLSARWKGLTDDDLTCTGAFIQAKKQPM